MKATVSLFNQFDKHIKDIEITIDNCPPFELIYEGKRYRQILNTINCYVVY